MHLTAFIIIIFSFWITYLYKTLCLFCINLCRPHESKFHWKKLCRKVVENIKYIKYNWESIYHRQWVKKTLGSIHYKKGTKSGQVFYAWPRPRTTRDKLRELLNSIQTIIISLHYRRRHHFLLLLHRRMPFYSMGF